MKAPLYAHLARTIDAYKRCQADWELRHKETLESLVRNELPSGSGWDTGTNIDLERSKPDHIILYGSYHHMHESGMYDGWTDHEIHIKPSLAFGFTLRITGRGRNDTKEYLYEIFDHALREEIGS